MLLSLALKLRFTKGQKCYKCEDATHLVNTCHVNTIKHILAVDDVDISDVPTEHMSALVFNEQPVLENPADYDYEPGYLPLDLKVELS